MSTRQEVRRERDRGDGGEVKRYMAALSEDGWRIFMCDSAAGEGKLYIAVRGYVCT